MKMEKLSKTIGNTMKKPQEKLKSIKTFVTDKVYKKDQVTRKNAWD